MSVDNILQEERYINLSRMEREYYSAILVDFILPIIVFSLSLSSITRGRCWGLDAWSTKEYERKSGSSRVDYLIVLIR